MSIDGPSHSQEPEAADNRPPLIEISLTEGGELPADYLRRSTELLNDWLQELQEGVNESTLRQIRETIQEQESAFPDTFVWDRQRRLLALGLQENGTTDAALDLVHDMRSRHMMVQTMFGMAEQAALEEDDPGPLLERFQQRFGPDEAGQRRLFGFVRAMTDYIIHETPDNPQIDELEDVLRRIDPTFDPLESWARSQEEVNPSISWQEVPDFIRQPAVWADMPERLRQSVFIRFMDIHEELVYEPSSEFVEHVTDLFNAGEQDYPTAKVWDSFRQMLADSLLEANYPLEATVFACAVKESHLQGDFVQKLLTHNLEEAALEVARHIREPRLMTQIFIEADWSDEQVGYQALEEVISDKSVGANFRAECIRIAQQLLGNQPFAQTFINRLPSPWAET